MSLDSQLRSGVLGEWCARRLTGSGEVAGGVTEAFAGRALVVPSRRSDGWHQAQVGRAFAIRMAAWAQLAPPYDALHGLMSAGLVRRFWADQQALDYPTHVYALLPERGKALDLRPTIDGWLDLSPGQVEVPGGLNTFDCVFGRGEEREHSEAELMLAGLFDRLRAYFAAHGPAGQIGAPGAEKGLARLCWLLAMFEDAYVRGVVSEPMRQAFWPRLPSAGQLHALADQVAVAELAELAGQALASGALHQLAGVPTVGVSPGIAWPTAATRWTGGDLLVNGPAGGTLLAVKTVTEIGDTGRLSRWLWQLLAGSWLDAVAGYRISNVALYFARHGALMTWTLEDLADRLLGGADHDSARTEFRELAERALASEGTCLAHPIEHPDLAVARRPCAIEEIEVTPDPDDFFLEPDECSPRPAWRVNPDGPTCPSRDLAELALPVCERLPEGWTLRCQPAPGNIHRYYWEIFKRRRGGHILYDTRYVGTTASGLARLVLFIEVEEKSAKEKASRAATAAGSAPERQQPIRGPESWRTIAGAEWAYWDLWFCVVCVADHDGDWSALIAAIEEADGPARSGPKLSHVLDLQSRLAGAGMTAAELVADAVADRTVKAKARNKVIKQSPPPRHMSRAMRDAPEYVSPMDRWQERALFGRWDQFPVSPQLSYDRLAAAAPFDLQADGWGRPARSGIIGPIEKAVVQLERQAGPDIPQLLAVRRAALTAFSLAMMRCDDSYGVIGDIAIEVLLTYSQTDWRRSGISPDVFWPDFFEIFCVLRNFGIGYDHEQEILRDLGIASDPGHVQQILDGLRSACASEGLSWQAETLFRLSSHVKSLPAGTS